jgi:hypothetical protein
MNPIRDFLEKWGIHALLLPIFFIVHTYEQYYGLITAHVALELGAFILLAVLILIVLILILTKHLNRTLQLVTLFTFTFLFFGVIKDFFQFSLHASLLSKYSVLLPLITVIAVLISRIILKKNNFKKSNLFINILIALFLLADISQFLAFNASWFTRMNLLMKEDFSSIRSIPVRRNRPDVYYLIFDSYPGFSFLNKYMGFGNEAIYDSLKGKGFYVLKNPKSNYNRTAFSIASTLNFQYLINLKPNHVGPNDYAQANLTIQKSIVPEFFKRQKYLFYNLSVFDIDTLPAIRKETFLTMPEENIFLYNTLTERLKNDVLWNLVTGKYAVKFIKKRFEEAARRYEMQHVRKNEQNRIVIDSLLKLTDQKTLPKFVYAHFYLPHPPFFYDQYGRKNNLKLVLTESSLKNKELFLSYLKYTNKVMGQIVDTILSRGAKNPVIIIESDHGYRDYLETPENSFTNFAAYYFPDQDYSLLYDTLSNINTFPIIFNKFFNTKIPLKKDSTVFITN